ncbi:hypothetical protein [Dokdonella sp.]|uniref:hypothetical protein n=1 Tax=Dokdonella sp. TaxID=2291710 RepID=UPI002F3FD467
MLNPTMPAWAEIPTLDLDRDRRPHGAGLDAPPPRRPLAAPSMPARDAILGALGIAALYTLPDLRAAAVPCRSPAMTLQASSDPSHDFDFLHGRWIVRNRRLRERLVGCADWDAFDGVQACRPILGGLGNEDEFITDAFGADRFIGMSIRLFDPRAREWSIFWVDNRSVQLQPPVRGRFDGGVGTFYGRDAHAGTPVLARFVWTVVSADRARWEQAFSTDEGASWETNWIMEFERSDA